VVLLVDHDAFDLDAVVEHSTYVFDARRVLPRSPNVECL
jgi:UDP-N-acetyl-D-mannosaminuronate dehydrogenase